MSDAQVEKVFAKMREALGDRLETSSSSSGSSSEIGMDLDMAEALGEARKLTTAKGKRSMPRAVPVDSEVRKKYVFCSMFFLRFLVCVCSLSHPYTYRNRSSTAYPACIL
jgi:hypothetical protein